MDGTLLLALALIPALIIAIVFHEVAHGWVALMLGDPTAKERGRLTLNPIPHVDPIGTLLLPGALAISGLPVFGWARPVPVIKSRLRNPRFGMMAVAAAGPGTNLVLALVGAALLGLFAIAVTPAGADPATLFDLWRAGAPLDMSKPLGFAAAALNYFIAINLFLALFNLLPVPPFDGSHIVEGLLPQKAARLYDKLRPIGLLLLFMLLLVIPWFFPELGIIERVVVPPVAWAQDKFLGFASWVAGG